tara:strand:- start:29547 stop:30572 length:1026 start_codon:yes stop_codon:yes gene_type:complete
MANIKISDLTAAASVSGTQQFEVNESGTSKKVTGAQIAAYVEGEVSSSPSFTGQASVAAGSAAAPSVTVTGDTNTGIYFPAADTVGISTGGTLRVSVDSSGSLVTAGNIELGNASDTTLSRVSTGVIAVEGVTVPLNSVTNTHTAQQIELGHATDTTLTRLAAGVIGVEGNQVITASGTAAQGDVLYYNGTAWVRLAAGTSGQFLKTNGAAANPAWASQTIGGITVVSTLTTTSGATAVASSLTLSGYKFLRINWVGVSCSTGNQYLTLNGANITQQLGNLSSDTVTGSAEWDLSSGKVNSVFGEVVANPTQSITTATTTLTFAFTAGNFDAGTITIYGIA